MKLLEIKMLAKVIGAPLINAANDMGRIALMQAADNGHEKVVKQLFKS